MDEALQAKLDNVLQKATAFAYLIEQAGPQGEVTGQDSTRSVTFQLAPGGRPDSVRLDPAWRQLLRGGSLAAAIQEAHDAAHSSQIENLVRPFARDTFHGLDNVTVPADFRDRYLASAKQSGEALIPTDLRDANEQLSRLNNDLDEAFRQADRIEGEVTEAAEQPEPTAAIPDEPVRFRLRGLSVIGVDIDPRWERNIPAGQAEESINEALAAALPTKEN